MNKRINNATMILVLLSIALIAWIILGGPFNTYYLVWNLILAWASMIFALIFKRNIKEGVLWN